MSKKILSLALVVVMLMSIFAFSTSALDFTASQSIGIRVESNAVVGMPEGTPIEFKFYYVLPAGVDAETYRQASATTAIAYTDGFKVDSTKANANDARDWGASYTDVFNPSGAVTTTSTVSNNIMALFNANDEAKGWDSALQVQQTYLSGGSYKALTGYPVDSECEVFTLRFVTTRELTAEDSIGVVEGAYASNYFKCNYWTSAQVTSTTYDFAAINMSEATAKAAAPVYKVGNAQYRPNGANYDLGVKFGFKTENIGIEFNEKGTSTNIASVGATLKVNGTPVAEPVESRFVYDVNGDNSEYQFRVVIEGVAADSTDKYEIATFVKYTNGTVRYADVVTINAADVIPG